MKNGFALLLSLIITSILLIVGMGVSGVAFREIQLSSFGNQSEIAFYAAETGLECALYWDKVKSPYLPNNNGFATSTFVAFSSDVTSGTIDCAGNSSLGFNIASSPSDTVEFTINNPYVKVTITKDFSSDPQGRKQDDMHAITTITATGYNTSVASDPRRVGRVLELELNPTP